MVDTLGVIVAGGRGRRLALGVPKALARLGGHSLLERTLTTAGALCDTIVVAAPAGMSLPVAGNLAVTDAHGACGPLAGLVAGLEARPHRRAIALGVDFPLLGVPMLSLLLERLPGHAAVLPAPGGIPQPLAAVYDGGAGAVLAGRLRAGERSVTEAALALDPVILGDADLERIEGGLMNFLNVNDSRDLAEAERRLATRAVEGSR